MNPILFVFAFVLFFLLTPKVLVCLPAKGSKFVVAGVHALIFALIFSLVGHLIWQNTHSMFEGMQTPHTKKHNINTNAKKESMSVPLNVVDFAKFDTNLQKKIADEASKQNPVFTLDYIKKNGLSDTSILSADLQSKITTALKK
jgi:hypothetical protein